MPVDISVESDLKALRRGLSNLEKQAVPQATVRTLKAGKAATAGTVGVMAIEAVQDTIEPATAALLTVAPYLESAKWLLLAVTLVGIAAMLWARIDDRRKGLR